MSRRAARESIDEDIRAEDLKICPVCGALNARIARACSVCSWHGMFETRPAIVETALQLLRMQHGILTLDLLADGDDRVFVHHTGFASRLRRFFSGMKEWLFG